MNWTKASAIGEILSSVAILATLVYLAIEIEQNADATRANTRQAMLASDQQYLELLIESPELHLLWYKSELTDTEKIRLSYFLITQLRMRENNWLQYKNGTLDESTWHSYRGSLLVIFSAPQTRAWWQNFGVERLYNADFLAEVDKLIRNQPVREQSQHLSVFN